MNKQICEELMQTRYSKKCINHAKALCELYNDTPLAVSKGTQSERLIVTFYFGFNDVVYKYYYVCNDVAVQDFVSAALSKHFDVELIDAVV